MPKDDHKNDPAEAIIDVSGPLTADPRIAEGLRLIKAFLQIRDPLLREALVDFAEQLADPEPRPLGTRAYS